MSTNFTSPAMNPVPPSPVSILLINPNSTSSMTDSCLRMAKPYLAPHVSLVGFTAPKPAPSAIEGQLDAILSTEACIRALSESRDQIRRFDAMLVACFSKHPLVDALKEEYAIPVIGIMEAALYTARMVGGRFGIVATGERSKWLQETGVREYGLDGFSIGSVATGLGVLELETKSRPEVLNRVKSAAKELVNRGADCVLLGCAGMTDMLEACEHAVVQLDGNGEGTVNVIDGVVVGIQLLVALVTTGMTTAKGGIYKSATISRMARGQIWV